MAVAIVVEAAGIPMTLASTAFVGALADGFQRLGVQTRVIGLVKSEGMWLPETLGVADAVAPWLGSSRRSPWWPLRAARFGAFDDTTREQSGGESADQLDEFLFEQSLRAMGADTGVLMVYPRSLPILTMSVRVAKRLGWRVVAFSTEALSDNQIDSSTRQQYIERVVASCDCIWVVSRFLREFWRSAGAAEEQLFLMPTVIRRTMFDAPSLPPQTGEVVYVGNLAHKEIEYLLEISESVQPLVDSYHLTVYGDALPDRRAALEAEIRSRGLSDVVRLELPVSPAKIGEVLRRASLLVLPRAQGEFSTAGFPNKLGEYLASGRPVVVTSVGDIPHYLVDGESAVLVQPDDTPEFAAAVVKLAGDPAWAARVGDGGWETARRMWSSEVVAANALEYFGQSPNPTSARLQLSPWVRFSRRFRGVFTAYLRLLRRAAARVVRAIKYAFTKSTL